MKNLEIIKSYKKDVEKAVNNNDAREVFRLICVITDNVSREQKSVFTSLAFDLANEIANSKQYTDVNDI